MGRAEVYRFSVWAKAQSIIGRNPLNGRNIIPYVCVEARTTRIKMR